MAELVPALRAQIERALANYKWHPGLRGPLEVPADLAQEIFTRSVVLGLDAQATLRKAISLGLNALDSSSVPTRQKIKEHLEGAHANVAAKYLPGRQRKRKAG